MDNRSRTKQKNTNLFRTKGEGHARFITTGGTSPISVTWVMQIQVVVGKGIIQEWQRGYWKPGSSQAAPAPPTNLKVTCVDLAVASLQSLPPCDVKDNRAVPEQDL